MKLFLIDGHALIFKMYYAFLGRPMVNSKGVDTSILFGFTKYLLELIDREKPTHLAVSFDPPGGTFRNRLYPEYKANRAETPRLVIDALEPLTAIVRAMNIPVLMVPDFEADDVIGSAAKRFAAEGFDVFMVTPDKDYGQLVDGRIRQCRPGKAGENEILGPEEVTLKWGIENAAQVVDILAICGDAADNVPGVAGVGPVGASKLLGKYHSVEGIYSHLDELTPRQAEQFRAAEGHIGLSKELVTIRTDVSLDVRAEDLRLDINPGPELEALFDLYEFGSLKRKLSFKASAPVVAPSAAREISFSEGLVREDVIGAGAVALELSEDGLYLAVAPQSPDLPAKVCKGTPEQWKEILEDGSVAKAGCGLKSVMNRLKSMNIVLRGDLRDPELMHYLLNPESSHKIDSLCRSYLGVELENGGQQESLSLFDEDSRELDSPAFRRVAAVLPLCDKLRAELETDGVAGLYDNVEAPLSAVLAGMEQTGVRIDLGPLSEFTGELRAKMLSKEAEVRRLAGVPDLNVSSPKQVGEVIFEKLRLSPGARKPKNGNWPTDEQTLSDLSDRSPIINAILDYRGLRKLLSTYIEPLPSFVSPVDGRVHTTFNQTLTATGRLSSSNPNLQNIPVRSDEGREIRKAFVPQKEGWVMMSADYSQIELRIMAHLCGDAHMTEAFRKGTDVHAATAARIFHKDVGGVTSDERRVAKTANFGIMYGISAFGLAQRLSCPRQEAKKIIEEYFQSFPSIRGFIDSTLDRARKDGYVRTMFGRRRYLPDLESPNAQVRAFAERNAVNAPIQGTAADIIKMAMTAVDRRLREEGLEAKMVLQIHDELLLEVPENEIDRVRDILVEEMEGVTEISVPLTVECNYGKNWLEAH
ncbi:MAG: DNA polymerase I [Bacteroidales bacterium]|nr:DNA polymerase I [Bacteroidales bacterium]